MYFVISIKTDEILSFNYTYLYNHTCTDLFHLLLEDTKNNLRFVNIYNDMQTSNNFINTQDTIHIYIENVYSICLLYSEFTYKNDRIVLLTKNYIGKLKVFFWCLYVSCKIQIRIGFKKVFNISLLA